MCMIRLDSEARQYGGFAPARRVFGRSPKLPIGYVDNPHFKDFTYRNDPPCNKDAECVIKTDGWGGTASRINYQGA